MDWRWTSVDLVLGQDFRKMMGWVGRPQQFIILLLIYLEDQNELQWIEIHLLNKHVMASCSRRPRYMGDWTQFSSEFNITFFKRYKHQEKAKHPHDKFAKLQPSPCPLFSRLTAQMSFNMYKENMSYNMNYAWEHNYPYVDWVSCLFV